MGGGISLPEAITAEGAKPLDCSDLVNADKEALLAEVKRMREVLAMQKGLIDTNDNGVGDIFLCDDDVGDFCANRKYMADGPKVHPQVATPSSDLTSKALSVVVFGATGDLARKKLYPSLYQLILMGHFPRTVQVLPSFLPRLPSLPFFSSLPSPPFPPSIPFFLHLLGSLPSLPSIFVFLVHFLPFFLPPS
jgi:hypothetical protein